MSMDKESKEKKPQAEMRLQQLVRERLADSLMALTVFEEWPTPIGHDAEAKIGRVKEMAEALKAATSHESFSRKISAFTAEMLDGRAVGGAMFRESLGFALSLAGQHVKKWPLGTELLFLESQPDAARIRAAVLAEKEPVVGRPVAAKQDKPGLIGAAALALAKMPMLGAKALGWAGVQLAREVSGLGAREVGREAKEAWVVGLAQLASEGSLPARLAKAKADLARDYGFAKVGLQNDSALAPAKQLEIIGLARLKLAQTAARLGIARDDVGQKDWTLLLLNLPEMLRAGMVSGVTMPRERILGVGVATTVDVLAHEWAHMLDAKLGAMATRKALKVDGEGSPRHKRMSAQAMFSAMDIDDREDLLPQAAKGYSMVIGAAQELLGDNPLRELSAETAKIAASSGVAAWRALSQDAGQVEAGQGLAMGKMATILKTAAMAGIGPSGFDSAKALSWIGEHEKEDGACGPQNKERLESAAREAGSILGLEHEAARAALVGALKAEVSQGEAFAAMASRMGPRKTLINPEAPFIRQTKAVLAADASSGADFNYWMSEEEMFARVIGSTASLRARAGEIDRGEGASAFLGLDQQRQRAKGWAMMMESAGFGKAKLSEHWARNIGEAGLAKIGKWREERLAGVPNEARPSPEARRFS